MNAEDAMRRIDTLLAHVWMVRTFLKHAPEAETDEDVREVHRELYDYMLALGEPLKNGDAAAYLRQAHKKYARLKRAAELFLHIQPDVSGHMNYQMAAQSLSAAVKEIGEILQRPAEPT
jgi:tRNA U34 5-carboxymethylaminomethyl modifying GTPase MnmE/TrmE